MIMMMGKMSKAREESSLCGYGIGMEFPLFVKGSLDSRRVRRSVLGKATSFTTTYSL